ncbi:MAG: phosphoglucosamine mutase [Bacillota bacterium]|nr:phosphoglucosamine mutase [Bacillota bacterium]
MHRPFGTDGVRETANTVLTAELALALGRAGAHVLGGRAAGAANEPAWGAQGRPRVVLGRDTRVSGPLLGAAVAAGAMSAGVDVIDLGVFPTAGVACLTRSLAAAGGVVISASHNPYEDNGIKFFGADGTKLSDEVEDEIAAHATTRQDRVPRPGGCAVGRALAQPDGRELYLRHVVGTVAVRLDGLRVVVDCANGATTGFAREALERLGAQVREVAASPDGCNINADCGSTHPASVAAAVVDCGYDLGLAFDGDGDRVVAVDGGGRVLDGDDLLAIVACDMLERDALPGRGIVATVMSNMGLDLLLASAGGRVVRTPVGDRQVYLAMRREGLAVGGEQSGHIIFLEHHTTGDGLITAVQLLQVLARRGQTLGEAAGKFERFPQAQRSVRVESRAALAAVAGQPRVAEAVREAERSLGSMGRVVLRPSGTEPVMRVMVEARQAEVAERLADELVEAIGREDCTGARRQQRQVVP